MEFIRILWDDENDPDGNVEHIAEHDLTMEDVEHVLADPSREGVSEFLDGHYRPGLGGAR